MHNYTIYCDAPQEGIWFKQLSNELSSARIEDIPSKPSDNLFELKAVLKYDRPDIILLDGQKVILVLERTVEVPSGHNVAQRFGRLVAAAELRIPVVYFGPYAAFKHGGNTSGPRYMNLRLFAALENLSSHNNTAVTAINWLVDGDYEILKTPEKDNRLKEYLHLFFNYYNQRGFNGLTEFIKNSSFQSQQLHEQIVFSSQKVRNPEQYDSPPPSVDILSVPEFNKNYGLNIQIPNYSNEIVIYHIGMNNIRSDPYTGGAFLYYWLYCHQSRPLILHFENINSSDWGKLNQNTKIYRMFKHFTFAILFKDKLIYSEYL